MRRHLQCSPWTTSIEDHSPSLTYLCSAIRLSECDVSFALSSSEIQDSPSSFHLPLFSAQYSFAMALFSRTWIFFESNFWWSRNKVAIGSPQWGRSGDILPDTIKCISRFWYFSPERLENQILKRFSHNFDLTLSLTEDGDSLWRGQLWSRNPKCGFALNYSVQMRMNIIIYTICCSEQELAGPVHLGSFLAGYGCVISILVSKDRTIPPQDEPNRPEICLSCTLSWQAAVRLLTNINKTSHLSWEQIHLPSCFRNGLNAGEWHYRRSFLSNPDQITTLITSRAPRLTRIPFPQHD